jgi:hypothetical protein
MATSITLTPLGSSSKLTLTPLSVRDTAPAVIKKKNLFIGTTVPASIYAGSTAVTKVYVGSTLIWEA